MRTKPRRTHKRWQANGEWWESPRYCVGCDKWKAMKVEATVCLRCTSEATRRLDAQAAFAVRYPWEAMMALRQRDRREAGERRMAERVVREAYDVEALVATIPVTVKEE